MQATKESFFAFDNRPEPQLYLIEPTKEERMLAEITRLRDQCERVRKGQYAKIGEVRKMVEDLTCRLDNLENAICRGNVLGGQ